MQIVLTCIDKLFKEASGAKTWKELPEEAKAFVEKIEKNLNLPVTIISTGSKIDDIPLQIRKL